MTLCELAQQYGTDKLRHGYTPLYDELFTPLRDDPVNVVELGVYRGASIRMWRDYFTNGTIYAVDVNPEHLQNLSGLDRVVPIRCNSRNERILLQIPDHVDIVIDDASHEPFHQIAAFTNIWPRVTPGGYYAVEDLHAGWAFDNGRHGLDRKSVV